jgi:hypothetical protein
MGPVASAFNNLKSIPVLSFFLRPGSKFPNTMAKVGFRISSEVPDGAKHSFGRML